MRKVLIAATIQSVTARGAVEAGAGAGVDQVPRGRKLFRSKAEEKEADDLKASILREQAKQQDQAVHDVSEKQHFPAGVEDLIKKDMHGDENDLSDHEGIEKRWESSGNKQDMGLDDLHKMLDDLLHPEGMEHIKGMMGNMTKHFEPACEETKAKLEEHTETMKKDPKKGIFDMFNCSKTTKHMGNMMNSFMKPFMPKGWCAHNEMEKFKDMTPEQMEEEMKLDQLGNLGNLEDIHKMLPPEFQKMMRGDEM